MLLKMGWAPRNAYFLLIIILILMISLPKLSRLIAFKDRMIMKTESTEDD